MPDIRNATTPARFLMCAMTLFAGVGSSSRVASAPRLFDRMTLEATCRPHQGREVHPGRKREREGSSAREAPGSRIRRRRARERRSRGNDNEWKRRQESEPEGHAELGEAPESGKMGSGGGSGSGGVGAGGATGTGGAGMPTTGITCTPQTWDTAPIGWATQGGGTTGGGNAAPITVTSLSALNAAAGGSGASVIHVSGRISGVVNVGSNKTILGLCGAEIDGSVDMSGSSNVILRNLKLVGPNGSSSTDTVHVQGGDHHLCSIISIFRMGTMETWTSPTAVTS